MSTLYQNNNQQQENNDQSRLVVTQPVPFPALFEVMYTDNEELPTYINGLFRPLFYDYYGSKLEIIQNKHLHLTAFFVESRPEGNKLPAIERILDRRAESGIADARIQTLNHMSSFGKTKLFKLTKHAEQILGQLVPPNFVNQFKKTVDWNKVTTENSIMLMNGTSQSVPAVQVVLDINKVLQHIYGGISDEKEQMQYMVVVKNPINPVSTPAGAISNKWQLFITRVNTAEAQAIASQFGFVIGSNNMGIITK